MKIHGHTPLPPTPPQLLPTRANANATTVASQTAATNSAKGTGAVTAWQSAAAGNLPAAGIPGQTIQPVAARQSSASSRGYVLTTPSKQAITPVTTIDATLNGDPAGDVPYTRGSIIDIEA